MLHDSSPFADRSKPLGSGGGLKICFLLNAQLHQALHALPIAMELARYPDLAVDVVAASKAHLQLASRLSAAAATGPIGHRLSAGPFLSALARAGGSTIPPKLLTLCAQARFLDRYDAIVMPERTSLLLRRLGVRRPLFIHSAHGAGDRAVGYDPRIARFDFALVAGVKQRERLRAAGLIRPGAHEVVGYPKFDAVRWLSPEAPHIFPERRPVVLYNPHCDRGLSSWDHFGEPLLRRFAADKRYNLIVAPHIKLFDRRERKRVEEKLAPFADLPHIHIDLGSMQSCDMSYTRIADLYIGDVSSQIYEYIARPRPCLLLDSHGPAWRDDPSYRCWHYGPVERSPERLMDAVDAAFASHGRYLPAQLAGLRDTFAEHGEPASVRAARVIRTFARERARHG